MKESLIFLITLMVISAEFLSGCFENINQLSNEENKFVGTWKLIEYGNYNITSTMVFFSDGTVTMIVEGMDYSGTYQIKDGKLVFNSKTSGLESYDYSFLDNGMKLTLQKTGTDINMIYIKQ